MLSRWKKTILLVSSSTILVIFTFFLFCLFYKFDTSETIVAVLDTGVDANHPLLKDRVLKGFDFIDWDSNPADKDGHGTHVSGTIVMLNKSTNVKILPIRKIGNAYNTPLAILYAIFNGADIVNMSFSQSYNLWTKLAIKFGNYKGVTFVSSSGNEGEFKDNYPAKYDGVISVVATNFAHQKLYGNYGEEVNYIAPGIKLWSADIPANNLYSQKTGTSMATAYVSGVLAYLKEQYPEASKEKLINYLNQHTRSIQYNVDGRTVNFKTVDFQKIQANEDDKSYFWLSPPATFSNSEQLSIPIETYSVQSIFVFDRKRLINKYKGDIEHLILPTNEGKHDVTILFYDKNEWKEKKLNYTVDTIAPKIKTNIKQTNEKNVVFVHIDDDNLKSVYINGELAKPLTGFTNEDFPVRDFYTNTSTEDKIKIEAYDFAGNKGIQLITK